MRSVILTTASRLLIALLLVFSVYMLLRGHNYPGGGFIGGLIAASGFVLYAIAAGPPVARDALYFTPRGIGFFGLALALIAGAMSALAGDDFFTGQWLILGDIALSSVVLFDIGVYFTVFGGILTLVFTLEEAL